MNPMVAFVGSGVMARCIYSIFTVNYQGKRISLESCDLPGGFRVVAGAGERVARVCHLTSCCSGLRFCTVLYKKKIVFKV